MTGRKLWRFAMDAARVVLLIVVIVFGGVAVGHVYGLLTSPLAFPHGQVTNLRR